MRKRKCKACGHPFEPTMPLQSACSLECAILVGRRTHAAKVKKSDQARRQKLKTLSQLRSDAQAEFNRYVRLRDAGLPCISCGRHHKGQNQAGHFLTTAAHPELRYEPRNCHLQCAPCNNHLSGNLIEYRKGLVARYGQPLVDWLEGPHPAKHYSRDDLEAEKLKWRKMARMLKDANDAVEAAREINFEFP